MLDRSSNDNDGRYNDDDFHTREADPEHRVPQKAMLSHSSTGSSLTAHKHSRKLSIDQCSTLSLGGLENHQGDEHEQRPGSRFHDLNDKHKQQSKDSDNDEDDSSLILVDDTIQRIRTSQDSEQQSRSYREIPPSRSSVATPGKVRPSRSTSRSPRLSHNRSRSCSLTQPSTSRGALQMDCQIKPRHENIGSSNYIVKQFVEALKELSKSCNHKLPSVGNIIPEFDPLSKTQTILDWIAKVEECAEIYDWDDREIIHYALPKLVGLAKDWLQSLSSLRHTWSEWKSMLLESFPYEENFADLLSEMLSLKVKYGEPLEQYYYAKLNLLNRCQITGKKAVDCILHGIEDRAIKVGAQGAQFKSPTEVLKYLKMVKISESN